ncbi:tRNA pseudouridine(55) synthase TruB [Cohnella panacarvi]|uniref:tRNA pseudouridine(55) synthase TruB n=1 Tax=Cohnella panacarvi TaxID=400776 RepID=UPI00047D3539|nr:tRNA pseudouridine(55) synthase TruB [Cohnella panacarvi]
MSNSGQPALDGVLAVWKPAGFTSHDVVAKARRILRERRIGHTGTLDPAVTGVLPLCIGRATRFVEYLQELPKTYEATLRFGMATDTEDLSGNVLEELDASFLTEDTIVDAASSFMGEIDQVPPMVSAVKMNGKRLYELAREGIVVERPSRRVTIYGLNVLQVSAGGPQPTVSFSVSCSKGTYIRTLCVDIGRKLGVPAVMAKLVRTESAGLRQPQCVTLEQLAQLQEEGTIREKLIPADTLVELPRTEVSEPESTYALQGKSIDAARLQPPPDREGLWKLYRRDGAFLGLFSVEENLHKVRPVKVFHPSDEQGSGNA